MENETRNRDQKYVTFVTYKISVQTFQGLNLIKTIHKSYRIPVQILQDSSPDVSGTKSLRIRSKQQIVDGTKMLHIFASKSYQKASKKM